MPRAERAGNSGNSNVVNVCALARTRRIGEEYPSEAEVCARGTRNGKRFLAPRLRAGSCTRAAATGKLQPVRTVVILE